MNMFLRLTSVLFLFGITSVAFSSNLKARVAPTAYYNIVNEWDDTCLAYINGRLNFTCNCNHSQAVWIVPRNQTQNVVLQNYYTGRYLGFQPGNRVPQLLDNPTNKLTRWTFVPVHNHNRHEPKNRLYWNITYNVVHNLGTEKCLHVKNETIVQSKCKPEAREHFSLEEIKFSPLWYRQPAVNPVPRPYKPQVAILIKKPNPQSPYVAPPMQPCRIPE